MPIFNLLKNLKWAPDGQLLWVLERVSNPFCMPCLLDDFSTACSQHEGNANRQGGRNEKHKSIIYHALPLCSFSKDNTGNSSVLVFMVITIAFNDTCLSLQTLHLCHARETGVCTYTCTYTHTRTRAHARAHPVSKLPFPRSLLNFYCVLMATTLLSGF